MRFFVATLLCSLAFGAHGAPPSFSGPSSLNVQVLTGESPKGQLRAFHQEARVDFGLVSNVGRPPDVGKRYTLDNGDAVFVTTIQVLVTPASSGEAFGPSRSQGRSVRAPSPRPSSVRKPALDQGSDLWASMAIPPSGGVGVIVAPAGLLEWDGPASPWVGPRLVVSGVVPGERVALDVGIYVPATAAGSVTASLAFEVR